MVGSEGAGDEGPCFAQVDFSIFGKESGEGGFFGEGAGCVVGGAKGVDLLVVGGQYWWEIFVQG